jgi:hypothetical protein
LLYCAEWALRTSVRAVQLDTVTSLPVAVVLVPCSVLTISDSLLRSIAYDVVEVEALVFTGLSVLEVYLNPIDVLACLGCTLSFKLHEG